MHKSIFNLSEAVIRRESTPQSFYRGQDYYSSGAVSEVTRRGDQIVASVEGSQYEPYTVSIDLDQDGIVDVTCDCPYTGGGWCKHIVATLLICLHKPERIEAKSSLQDLLSDLDRAQLYAVLVHLAESDASLIEQLEHEVSLIKTQTDKPSAQDITVDQDAVRHQVRRILHSLDHMRRSEAYWHVARVVDQTRQVLARVHGWIEDGDTANAFAFLEAITDAYIEDWKILDDSNGDPSGFFADLGNAWESAACAADLSPAERRRWAQKLADWQEQLYGYELDEAFDLARMELEEEENEP